MEPTMRPALSTLTSAPLRNRIRVELHAPVATVWTLLGDLARFPEYSAGLERVDATVDSAGRCTEYVCHFKPMAPGDPGIVDRNVVRWFEPAAGYASSGKDSAFGLIDDVNLVTLDPAPAGTLLTWDEYFEADDLAGMRVSFDQAIAGIAERLIARFRGRVRERFVDGNGTAPGPEGTVVRLSEAINRGDLEAAVGLYEPNAVLVAQPGQLARGLAAIRDAMQGFIALRPTLSTATSQVIESGDVALYLGRWSLSGVAPDGGAVTMGGDSSDVLRRQADGRWLIVLDNPWGTGLLSLGGTP
jgi:uncharacterized protein (TIGR02246 family)